MEEVEDEETKSLLTDEQINEFQDAFDLFDRDDDATITVKEFCTIMRVFGQTQYEIELEEMFRAADVGEKGTINFGEFLGIMKQHYVEDKTSEGINEAFRAFDPLRKGIIPADDLREYMMAYGDHLTEEEASAFIKAADSNKDGQIMYEYFVSKMASKLEKPDKYQPKFAKSKSKTNNNINKKNNSSKNIQKR
ncbi:calmodulin-like [Diabrotica virgifera virgifera]|uniref:Calmodulin-like n=1 Tax=Diabrotica virgifera virgifera TaxID=50390 RepID=A0A6P7G9M9_DIAVI|nr:calmodulin-like [Diabrotica virgifera virgifera]